MTRRKARPGAPEGGLVVDKASGLTSHDVVAMARRAFGQPRVGHTGTLDPLATGVLPLLLGRATRLAQFLVADLKAYDAVVRFGQDTSTYDADGEPVGPSSTARVDEATVASSLARFRGTFEQTPPAVSAKRVGGHRAYDLARTQTEVALVPVTVAVHALELIGCDGREARLRIECSAGFYVRSLAHELGQALGVGAHLAALRRTRSGRFTLEGAASIEQLVREPETLVTRLWPLADLVGHFPAAVATEEGRQRLGHGRLLERGHLAAIPPAGSERVRILGQDRGLLAIADYRADALHPVVVLM